MGRCWLGRNKVKMHLTCELYNVTRPKLEPITRLMFHPDDDDLLTYLQDDGASIEPIFYMPVIPMVLVNGAEVRKVLNVAGKGATA